jgi:hypothetical protein
MDQQLDMDRQLELPSHDALNAMFWKRVDEINQQHVIATLVYLFAALVFDVPAWKSFAIAAMVGYCIFARFGRALLVKSAVILLMISLVEWSGAFGHMNHWFSYARGVVSQNIS